MKSRTSTKHLLSHLQDDAAHGANQEEGGGKGAVDPDDVVAHAGIGKRGQQRGAGPDPGVAGVGAQLEQGRGAAHAQHPEHSLEEQGLAEPGAEGRGDGVVHGLGPEAAPRQQADAHQHAVGPERHERDVEVGRVDVLPRRQVAVPARDVLRRPHKRPVFKEGRKQHQQLGPDCEGFMKGGGLKVLRSKWSSYRPLARPLLGRG